MPDAQNSEIKASILIGYTLGNEGDLLHQAVLVRTSDGDYVIVVKGGDKQTMFLEPTALISLARDIEARMGLTEADLLREQAAVVNLAS